MEVLIQKIKSFFGFGNKSQTIKYMFPALISFVAMLSAAVINSTEVSYIRLETTEQTVQENEVFQIEVYAYAHVPVNAVDITLQFDPAAVEVTSVDKGQSVITIWAEEPKISNGTVVLKGGTYRKGFLKEHKIATLNAKAKKTGQSTFKTANVVLLAGDGQGTKVSVSESNGSAVSLYVFDENTDPGNIGVDVTVKVVTDIDGDGKVTLKDISVFMAAWQKKNVLYDFNGDGRMTFRDFSIILANFFL